MTLASKSTTPANNSDAPPNGAPEGMLAAAVNDTIRQFMADVKGGVSIFVATKSDMSALDLTKSDEGNTVILGGHTTNGDGAHGLFKITKLDISTEVSNDTAGGVFVAPDSDNTGVSGGFIRQFSGAVNLLWFGPDGTLIGDSAAHDSFVAYLIVFDYLDIIL